MVVTVAGCGNQTMYSTYAALCKREDNEQNECEQVTSWHKASLATRRHEPGTWQRHLTVCTFKTVWHVSYKCFANIYKGRAAVLFVGQQKWSGQLQPD